MSGLDPARVMARLQEIEEDLAGRQNGYEEAAEQVARLKRDYELAVARATTSARFRELKVDERKAHVLLAVEQQPVFHDYMAAEARLDGFKAALAVLEKRASIGQSILRALTQEAFRVHAGAQPAWSDRRQG